MMREDRAKGFFLAFDFSSDALTNIDAFFRKQHKAIIALTVREILEEQSARKLACGCGDRIAACAKGKTFRGAERNWAVGPQGGPMARRARARRAACFANWRINESTD
jgi:hypothetical protein